ncbi:MAG TPA: hypothetical protein VN026_07225 [Bacteroidia bacterium]|jgi:hypothetical protein|nr:hypothetical protein [Bacteroidia bacterium]
MKKKDYSREIFEKFYNPNGKVLEVILKNGTVLEGIFIGFVHGDESSGEPFIIKWHFIDKSDISKHNATIAIDWGQDYGRLIEQEEIKSIKFKTR